MRKHKDQVLGPLAELLERAPGSAENGGARVAEEAAGLGGRSLIRPDGMDGGEVERGGCELDFGVVVLEEDEKRGGRAGIAGVIRQF